MTISVKLMASIVSVLVAVVAFLGGMSHEGNLSVSVLPNQTFGAAGSEFFSQIMARDGITIGGKVIASSTAATETLAATDINNVAVLNLKAAAAATVTLPSKSVLSGSGFLQNAGDTATITIHASTSAITLVGATGVSLQTNASSTIIYPFNTAKLIFTRLPAVEGSTYEVLLTGSK